jgi:undecaprenyl diphosphate synthase
MASPAHDLNELKRRMQGAIQLFKQELGGLRTGRASASLLEPVQVEAYGTHMPLNQVATVSVPEPRLISVQVWDRSMVHAVEKAIAASNLGLTPATEGQVLRLRIPELNEERRRELVKVAHKYAEAARVAVRHVRRDGLDVLKKLEKDHKISEDEGKRQSEQVQKATDQVIADIDRMLAGPVPRHFANILDGNGRWAAARGLPRAEGHRRGVEALRRTVRAAGELGIGFLTIFSFSAENWSRPPSEIRELMALLRRFIRNDLAELHRSGVKVRVIGERENLNPDIRRLLEEAEQLTRHNEKLVLVVAFNYGARQEIARAAQRVAAAVSAGDLPLSAVTADNLGSFLDAPDLPDPDLIIRTSGEQRLSNFLLWQAAYSELVFVPTYWPDFDRAALENAVGEYQRRERRFGGLVARTG